MTEDEWLSGTNLKLMLELLRGKASDRKLRLFAVACCCVSHLAPDQASRNALEVAERYADGLATEEERQAACTATLLKGVGPGSPVEGWEADYEATSAIGWATVGVAFDAAAKAPRDTAAARIFGSVPDPIRFTETEEEVWTEPALVVYKAERALQCDLLRDIIGNPFRPLAVEPSWLAWNDGTVVNMAQGIYDDRAFDRLSVLADALEDAGCHDAAILDHCRQPGQHVRVCWIVHILLGRS
jgi:hypothetical protein